MIQPQTYLKVADNTGARKVICIRVLGSSRAKLGSTIIAVIKESLPNIPVQRSEIVRAVVVRTCQDIQRPTGSRLRFDENAVVLINKDGNPRGSRVFGPVARELRDQRFTKIVSLAPEVILIFLLLFMRQRLKRFYKETVIPQLCKEFRYTNVHQIPSFQKIVINRGVGEGSQNSKMLEISFLELENIATQRGIVTRARKAIAGFKIRESRPVGLTVTLRRERIYAFFDRLINLALPRIRDFYGVNWRSFDGNGNYNLGLEEQLIFPELSYEQINKLKGFDISIVTTAKTDDESLVLLKGFGIPFQNCLYLFYDERYS